MRESEGQIANSGLDKLSILTSESEQRIWVGPLRIRETLGELCRAHTVAVGTGIAPRPPHRPGRARLTHPVLIAGKMRTDRGSHEHPL